MDRLQIVIIITVVSRCYLGYSTSTELPTSTTPITTTPTSTLTTETSTTTTCGAATCTSTPTTTTCVNLCTTTTPTTTTQTTTQTTTTTTPKTITHTTAPITTPTTTPATTTQTTTQTTTTIPKTITHTTAPTTTPTSTPTTTTPTSTTMITTPTMTTCRETICTTTTPVTTTSTVTTPIMTTPMSTTTCEYICTTTTPTTTTQTTTKTTTTISPTIPPTTTTTPVSTTIVETTPTTTPVATTPTTTPVKATPTTTPITTVKTSTTPSTKTEPTTTPVECHMPPPRDCCIRKQLRISLKHVPVVLGKVPYVSVMEKTTGKIRRGCDAKILLNATFQKNSVFDTCQSCTKVPKCGRKMLRIDLQMALIKTGFSLHVGDSRTNNGYKGDASTQENDAEFHFLGYRHLLYGSDKCSNMSLNMTGLLRIGVTSVTIFIGNEFIRVSNNYGYVYELCSKCLFSLNGQSDAQGPVNENIFIGLNRIIDSSSYRDGTGVCSAVIRWACPWDC